MSWAFITAIKQNPKQSYVELLNSIRDVLETKYSQKPQLSCSHPLGKSFISTYGSSEHRLRANIRRYEPPLRDVNRDYVEVTEQ